MKERSGDQNCYVFPFHHFATCTPLKHRNQKKKKVSLEWFILNVMEHGPRQRCVKCELNQGKRRGRGGRGGEKFDLVAWSSKVNYCTLKENKKKKKRALTITRYPERNCMYTSQSDSAAGAPPHFWSWGGGVDLLLTERRNIKTTFFSYSPSFTFNGRQTVKGFNCAIVM